jgi:hypothetical protein
MRLLLGAKTKIGTGIKKSLIPKVEVEKIKLLY